MAGVKNCTRFLWGLLLLGTGTGNPATAADAHYDCRFTEGPITIDGRSDEPAWQAAVAVGQSEMPLLRAGATGQPGATRARLLWDRERLYVTADLNGDANRTTEKKPASARLSDGRLEVWLRPDVEQGDSYQFQIRPDDTWSGWVVQWREEDGVFRRKRALQFAAAVSARVPGGGANDQNQGWTVELGIPWSELIPTGGRPEPGDEWWSAFGRLDALPASETPNRSRSGRLGLQPAADWQFPGDRASIRFLSPDQSGVSKPYGIPVYVPVTTNRVAGAPEPPPPYVVEPVYPKAGMDAAIVVAAQPGSDRLLVATEPAAGRPSQILRLRDSPAAFAPETLIPADHPERKYGTVHYSITFHPDFAKNGYVFIGSNGPRHSSDETPAGEDGETADRMTRITRYRIDPHPPYTFHADSARLIIEWDSDGHDGGDTAFGPDGMLYVTSGDGTSDFDADCVGQDLSRLRAKVLRLDVDHPEAANRPEGHVYLVPSDNPFVGQPGVRPETWAYGLRNPWRITCDPSTGHIWVGNNGQDLWEQVYLLQRGANYGWSRFEGSHPFATDRTPGPDPVSPPTFEHSHAESRSLTGGVVYHGDRFPELRGCYLYGDYSTGRIWAAQHDGERVLRHDLIADTTLQITSFCVTDRGDILMSDHQAAQQGGIHRLARRPPTPAVQRSFPQRLSESGLFASITDHTMAAGVIPYGVNSPLWSDGTHKVRFMAVPSRLGDQHQLEPEPIHVTNENGWQFPDGTVLVKSFAIEHEAGNPAARHWIETRFMLKEEGEWAGYSYEWNADQTDAVLVEAAGKDRIFTIGAVAGGNNPEGVKTLQWHYPSRVECMVCHSRASNFVLGLCTVQLNRDFDYAAVLGADHATDNQLRTLEHLGMLRSDWWQDAVTTFRKSLPPRAEDETRLAHKQRVQAAIASWIAPADPADKTAANHQSRMLSRSPVVTNRLVNPLDVTADLASRARSYLHSNCGSCHQMSGGGNALFSLLFRSAFGEHELATQHLVEEPPLHSTFGLPDARIIAAGAPARSVLYTRISRRGRGQMPQLATSRIDEAGMAVVREWIESLKPPEPSQ